MPHSRAKGISFPASEGACHGQSIAVMHCFCRRAVMTHRCRCSQPLSCQLNAEGPTWLNAHTDAYNETASLSAGAATFLGVQQRNNSCIILTACAG